MELILSKELIEAIHKAGDIIKADHRCIEMAKASEEYDNNAEIRALLDEYSTLQEALSAEYTKPELDDSVIKPMQDRMNEIFTKVTNDPAYVRLKEASELYSEMTDAVYEELEFAITGKRREKCTHDCSTCHGCD
ncbi:MAG: YlbF family regulator [Clostridia bacterium]|nr:YlbF family regulator [Clostridia bacterium]